MAEKQSQVDPRVQAQRVEQAGRGEYLAMRQRDADLAVLGLPPEAVALIGGARTGTDLVQALRVAVWVAGCVERAGLSEAARMLWELSQGETVHAEDGEHVWRQREASARALARRVFDFEDARQESGGQS